MGCVSIKSSLCFCYKICRIYIGCSMLISPNLVIEAYYFLFLRFNVSRHNCRYYSERGTHKIITSSIQKLNPCAPYPTPCCSNNNNNTQISVGRTLIFRFHSPLSKKVGSRPTTAKVLFNYIDIVFGIVQCSNKYITRPIATMAS